MASGLTRKDARGSAITLGTKAVATVLSLGGTAVLARLLTPADFGLVDMMGTAVALLGTFGNFGLSQATVQKYKLERGEVNNLFWLNVVFGLTLWGLGAALAPALALFYHAPALVKVAQVGSLVFLFTACKAQPEALLQRQRRFFDLGVARVGGQAAGLAAGLFVAFKGGAYWALITNSLVSTGTNALLALVLTGFVPARWDKHAKVWPMLKFGSYLVLSAFINYFARNLDKIVIGRVWQQEALGKYSRAYKLFTLPLQLVSGPLTTVMLPSLARKQHSPKRLGLAWTRAVAALIMTAGAVSLFLALEAKGAVLLLLGSQWLSITPYVQVLCAFGVVQPIINSSGWVFISSGKTRYMAITGAINTTLLALAFLFSVKHGILPLVYTYSLVMLLLCLPINLLFILKVTQLPLGRLLRSWGTVYGLLALWIAACFAVHQGLVALQLTEPITLFFGVGGFALLAWLALVVWGPFELIAGLQGRRK